MTDRTPPAAPATLGLPDFEPLRRAGWSVQTVTGTYCLAWRGADEVVFAWRGGGWHQLTTRSLRRAA